ncbi:MAG TPA: MBL fold metallo-hydrolase RNA specificity domain-containing protein [Candidatus Thermoplasmatota archaeon]|nr:MBL fold metallo-hydrolase RNA specificity domain-containing protein [Candidatus Thermoplasmatota archaeon]
MLSSGVSVRLGNGIEVETPDGILVMDPGRAAPGSVVTHAHLDHLTPGAHMTPATLDLLRIRKPGADGLALGYGVEGRSGGVPFRLHDAGHVFGSAMVEAAGVLYTGDFNPHDGLTCGRARPVKCDVLVTESTYGDPRFDLPPKPLVLESVERWMLRKLLKGPVALGAYQLGRAQELIALANRSGIVPVVSGDIGGLSAVYNAHGHDLAFAVMGSPKAQDLESGNALYVVPRAYLKKGHDFARKVRAGGGAAAYLSGWCHVYQYFEAYDIEAQFSLSDHAGFRDLLAFAEACAPRQVLTTHGAAKALARELRKRGIRAEPLE